MAAIIFDFDGTIADTFEDVVQIFHRLTGRHQKLPEEEVERLRGLSLTGIIEDLQIPPWKIPFLMIRGRQRMARKMSTVEAQPGIIEIIKKIYAEGHQLFIISSNSRRNIRAFLRKHQLQEEFVEIYGSVGLFSKGRALKKIVRRNHLNPAETWYIGDEVRDVLGAHHAGLRMVAVSWGYNTATILQEHKPTRLVSQPAELLKILEEI